MTLIEVLHQDRLEWTRQSFFRTSGLGTGDTADLGCSKTDGTIDEATSRAHSNRNAHDQVGTAEST